MATALTPILPGWLEAAAALSVSVTLLRVSSDSTDKLTANADANAVKLAHLPSMQRLRAVGGAEALLGKDAAAIALRRKLGVVEILRSHASEYAELPKRVMGHLWAMEEEQDLLLFLTDSAAEDNISRLDDPIKQNAVAEILVQLALHPKIGRINTPEWSRLIRAVRHGSRIVTAAGDGRVKIYEGNKLVDFSTASGQIVTTLMTLTASGERNGIVEREVRGVLGKLTRDEFAWPYAPASLFPAYTIKGHVREKTEGKSIRVATVCADTLYTEGLTEFFKAIANGATYLQAGKILAKHKIPTRGVRIAGKTYADLTDQQLYRAAVTLSAPRHFQVLRSGRYTADISVPVRLAAGEDFHGHEVTYSDDPKHPNGFVHVDVPLPKHGIELTEEEWNKWKERISIRQSREPGTDVPRRALGGTGFWRSGGNDYRISCQGAMPWVYYRVQSRPVAQSVDKFGKERGWRHREGDFVLTSPACEVEMALGRAIEEGALKLIEQTGVLSIVRRDKPDERQAEEVRKKRRSEIICQISDVCEDLLDAQDAFDRNPSDRRKVRLSEVQSLLSSLNAEQDSLVVVAGESETELVDSGGTEEVIEVDVSNLASVAGLLQGSGGKLLPRLVNDTLREITRGSVRIEILPENPDFGMLKATIHWPDQAGETLTFDVCAKVRLSTRKTSLDSIGRAATQLILEAGLSIEEATEMFVSKHNRRSVILKALAWLGSNGVEDHRLRRALLDCPIKETKAVAWALLAQTALPDGVDHEFAELIRLAYLSGIPPLGGAGTWAQSIQFQRTALTAFATWSARGENITDGINVDVLAPQIGCQPGELLRLAGRGKNLSYLRLFEHHPLDARVLLPRRCPKCARWLLHVLRTPETLEQDGLICSHCQTLPSGIKLPPDYLALWDAPGGDHNICNGRGTFLAKKSDYELGAPVPGESRLMRIGEASMVLGIPQHRLREWSNRGLINSQRKGKDEDRYYHSDEIAKATALTAPTHPGMMPTDKLPDGYVVLSAAAKTLNVAYWDLTRLATSTPWNEGPLPYQKKGGGTRGMYIVSEANLAKIAPEWLDSCSRDRIRMAEAVRYTGLGPSVLGRAIIRGELKCAITAGKCRFRYSELDQWMSDRGRLHKMLIPKHAAEAAGVSAETLSAAVKKGELNAEHTCGGHARFNLDEVLKWASKRP